MMRQQRILTTVTIGAVLSCIAWLATLPTCVAGELRANWQGKPIVRQMAYTQPVTATPDTDSGALLSAPASADLTFADAPPIDGQIFNPIPMAGNWVYWGKVEFLLWWRRGKDMPALVTTSSPGTSVADSGVLGLSTTSVLYGGQTANNAANVGGRVMFGAWLDCQQVSGLGVRFYTLGNSTDQFNASSDTYPILARPFYNVTLGREDSDVVAHPTETSGSISVISSAKTVGGDAFWRRLFYEDSCHRIDLLVGYQTARIDQDIRIDSSRTVTATGGTIPVNTVVDSYDLFDTENVFHGVSVGMIGEYDRGPITWRLLAKVGLGNMQQRSFINGGTTTTVPGQGATTVNQGLLAQTSNIGQTSRTVFTASPELALSCAYHVNACIDVTAGYSFIFWNHVMQPADQIDRRLDVRDQAAPVVSTQDSDYFLQGLNFGVQFAY